jgi:recombination protein RecT
MGKKTVIKRVLKLAPLSSDIQMNIAQDETIKSNLDADMSFVGDETDFVEIVDDETGEVKDGE